MSPRDLERYLHEQIPLSAAMQVAVLAATPEQVRLAAPLAPNINHRRTVFGGSAAAVATLAAWGLLHLRLSADGFAGRLVIRRSEMDFEQAIAGDFEAEARAPDERALGAFPVGGCARPAGAHRDARHLDLCWRSSGRVRR